METQVLFKKLTLDVSDEICPGGSLAAIQVFFGCHLAHCGAGHALRLTHACSLPRPPLFIKEASLAIVVDFSVTSARVSECLGCVQRVASQGQGSLPGQLVIVTDKGKTSKEQDNLVVKEAMCAMLQAWDAPFRSACILT